MTADRMPRHDDHVKRTVIGDYAIALRRDGSVIVTNDRTGYLCETQAHNGEAAYQDACDLARTAL